MHAITNTDDARRSAIFQSNDKEARIMLKARKTRTKSQVHSSFDKQRQLTIRGDACNYMIDRADRAAFVAAVARFGFSPADFALNILHFWGKRSTHSPAVTFAMTVENLHTGRRATYLDGPGVAWVPEFLLDLIAGTFGRP
jgi:hypothetical protein